MSDIFISYASADRDRILPLVNALEKTEWSVFWDRTIPAGKTWWEFIGAEIQSCRSVVVVWTENSIKSNWVYEEADTGKRKRILIPVLFDKVEPPFGFGGIQAANLAAWDGDNSSPTFSRLIADIAAIIGPSPAAVKKTEERRVLEAEAQRKAEEERLRAQERQRAEEEARRKNEEEDQRRIEEERNRAEQEAEQRRLEAEAQRKAEQKLLREQERQRSEEEAKRKTEEENRRCIEEERNRAEQEAPTPARAPKKPESSRKAGTFFRDRLKDGSQGPGMVVIPAGTFIMGDNQGGWFTGSEKPLHQVKIPKPFAMGRYEVTFEEYDQFAKATGRELPGDEGWGRGRLPVINVSWNDAVAYVEWLSQQTGKLYRLPTEAEWEYTARGRTETRYWWGNEMKSNMANCNHMFTGRAMPVGSFKPNTFGIYDTAGNVWELVQDYWHGDYNGAPTDGSAWGLKKGGDRDQRVMRGGHWGNVPGSVSASTRILVNAAHGSNGVGFRLARDLD